MKGQLLFMLPLSFAALCAIPPDAQAQDDHLGCGSLANHYGPFDYRTSTSRSIVENVHFTPKVESLRGGNTSITAGGDINYTLHVFPNHTRALMAVMRLAEQEKKDPPRDVDYTVECWFYRGEQFRPDDAMVLALHGSYLIRSGKAQQGAAKLEAALALAGDNANIHYNLGLAFFELKQYDKALESAHRAYALGFPLPGLRDKLKRAGKWQEPAASGEPKATTGVPAPIGVPPAPASMPAQ